MKKVLKEILKNFPSEIQEYIGSSKIKEISIGRSGDSVYEIYGMNNFILKISSNIKRLEFEKNIFEWLRNNNKLPVPDVLLWYKTKDSAFLATKKIKGKMACGKGFVKRPDKLIKFYKQALQMVKNVDCSDFPYLVETSNLDNKSFSHGDLCLPNIIIHNNKVVGFLDLGDASIRNFEYDIATGLRSFEYNIDSKEYSEEFLKVIKSNFIFNEEKVMEYYPNVFG